MPDLTTFNSLFGTIKTAFDVAKMINDSAITFDKAETKLKLADLISTLAEAKIEISNIQELIIEKDKTISSLKKLLDINDNLKWDQPYYWIEKDGLKDGPYCQHCWDNNKKLIRLQVNSAGSWDCTACKNRFYVRHY